MPTQDQDQDTDSHHNKESLLFISGVTITLFVVFGLISYQFGTRSPVQTIGKMLIGVSFITALLGEDLIKSRRAQSIAVLVMAVAGTAMYILAY